MKNFLQDIVLLKRKEIEISKAKRPLAGFIESRELVKGTRPFKEAISARNGINLIAEIKKKSPSSKSFFRKLDVLRLAKLYASAGAKALSVLTDKKFFGGNISHIREARVAADLPVLRKDFIIDEYQVYESRYFGADAILLIARILPLEEIKSFTVLAKKIGMDALIEIHDENDLEKAVIANAEIIGINNRDLDTFEVSIETTFKLAPKIPNNIIKVSESGISDRNEILRLKKAGINAMLIGSAFLGSPDMMGKIGEIMSLAT